LDIETDLVRAPADRWLDHAPHEVDGIAIVQWPEEADRAEELTRMGIPTLMLVAPDAEPPDTSEAFTAWVRMPTDERDLQTRIVELRSAASAVRPILGDHAVLWRGTRWIALSPIESRLCAAFLSRPGRVLSRARLEQQGWADGAPNARAIDARIKVLRRRIAPFGICIHTVRGEGYLAEILPDRAA